MSKSRVQGGQKTADNLRKKGLTLRAALKEAVTESAIDLVAHVKGGKLSGQVLRAKTGRLRRSINPKFSQGGGDRFSATVGTNVEYARRFELGWNGTESVRTYLRKVTTVYGKKLRTPVMATVRAHQRQANQPERSFLRSALKDLRPVFEKRINDAIKKAKES